MMILFSLAGIVSTFVGGLKLKYKVSGWIVLSGFMMIMFSVVLASLYMSLGGVLLSYASLIPILIILGLGCIVIGGLIDEK